MKIKHVTKLNYFDGVVFHFLFYWIQ